jgi:hypothetical protein
MELSTLMAGYTPSLSFAGVARADDMVLAIDTTQNDSTLDAAFVVVGPGITGITPALNPTAQDKNYLRVGVQTEKTGEQRTFKIVGDRMFGDAFQDWALAVARKFGKGATVKARYLWFNVLTGLGERGKVSLIVNNDGGGDAGANATIDIDMKSTGGAPVEYTYAASTLGALTVVSVAGTTSGTSKITVSGNGGGQLVYKSNASVLTPAFGDEASGYTLFDSGADLTLTTGQKVNVAEINSQGKIMAHGSQTIASKP